MTGFKPYIAGALVFLAVTGAQDQTALAQGLPASDAAEALADLARQSDARPVDTAAPVSGQPRNIARPPRFLTIREVTFLAPSGYLSETELRQITEPFIGQRLRVSDVARIAQAINAAYAARGVDLAQAQIEDLDAQQGLVTIRLFEARLGQLDYEVDGVRDDYIRFRLGLEPGDLASTRRIGTALERLALTDGLLADARFLPGMAPGETDLSVRFEGVARSGGVLRFDNYGDVGSGELRSILSLSLANVSGRNDPLAVDLTFSKESKAAVLSYARVVTPGGGRLVLGTYWEDSGAITGPARDSKTRSVSAAFSLPLLLERGRSITAAVSLDGFDESVATAGLPTADQSGWIASASLSGARRFETTGSALRFASWSTGLTFGTYDDAVRGRNGIDFSSFRASGRLEWEAGSAAYVSLAAALQFPLSGNLPSRSEFTVTSPFAVPGYDNGLSAGDGGYWMRLQIERSQGWGGADLDIRPYGFIAQGQAYDKIGGRMVGQGTARSVGFGLSATVGRNLEVDIQGAVPLNGVLGQGTQRDPVLRAALSVSF